MVRRATSLHDDLANLAIGKEALKLSAGQAVRTSDAPSRISLRHLEDGLCQIDGNGCSIHVGLLSFDEDLIPTPMKTRARISRKQTGESIPSFDTDARRWAIASLRPFPTVDGQLRR